MNRKYGWYRTKAFEEWLSVLIALKTGDANITFQELKHLGFKELYVTGTCLNQQRVLVFSAETYPNMKVKDAVKASMAIPLYFEPVYIDSLGNVFDEAKGDLDIVVDGGILANFPIQLFDHTKLEDDGLEQRIPNFETLGFRIDHEMQILVDQSERSLVPVNIDNIQAYIYAFYVLVLENLNRNQLIKEDWDRTISISDAGVGPKVK